MYRCYILPIIIGGTKNSPAQGEVWIDEVKIVKGESEDIVDEKEEKREKIAFSERLNELKRELEEVRVTSEDIIVWKETISAELSALNKKIKEPFTISNIKEINSSFDYLDSLITALKEDRVKFKDILLYAMEGTY
ncbi:MAG: hypothetical protein KAX20_06625 [Candidatus Omnitrophica bacterium]|nr:hypothetical protein [Candidatus Omnitrophota bacterium]